MKITKARMKQIISEEVALENSLRNSVLLKEASLADLPPGLQDVEKAVLGVYKDVVAWSRKTAKGVEDKEAQMTLMKIPIAIKIAAQNIAKVAKSDNAALLDALGSDEGPEAQAEDTEELKPTADPALIPDANSGDEDIKARELEAGDTYQYTSKKGNDSIVKVEDPKNDVGAVVLQKVNPKKGCKPTGHKFAADPKTFASAIDDEIENCEIDAGDDAEQQKDGSEAAPEEAAAAPEAAAAAPEKAAQARPDNGASRGKQVSPNAAKKRKAKQKQQKKSRKRNRPGNRPDQVNESLEELILQEIDEVLRERELEECGACSTCGDPAHDHTHDEKTGIRISISSGEEEYEIDPASLI